MSSVEGGHVEARRGELVVSWLARKQGESEASWSWLDVGSAGGRARGRQLELRGKLDEEGARAGLRELGLGELGLELGWGWAELDGVGCG